MQIATIKVFVQQPDHVYYKLKILTSDSGKQVSVQADGHMDRQAGRHAKSKETGSSQPNRLNRQLTNRQASRPAGRLIADTRNTVEQTDRRRTHRLSNEWADRPTKAKQKTKQKKGGKKEKKRRVRETTSTRRFYTE